MIIVPRTTKDGWKAELSDGREFDQDDAPGYLSAWLRLKELCDKERVCIKRLWLTVGSAVVSVEGNALGYWQAQRMVVCPTRGENGEDVDLHWRGIGHVARSNPGIVHIRWLAYPHANKSPGMYNVVIDGRVAAIGLDEQRLSVTQKHIIWSDHGDWVSRTADAGSKTRRR